VWNLPEPTPAASRMSRGERLDRERISDLVGRGEKEPARVEGCIGRVTVAVTVSMATATANGRTPAANMTLPDPTSAGCISAALATVCRRISVVAPAQRSADLGIWCSNFDLDQDAVLGSARKLIVIRGAAMVHSHEGPEGAMNEFLPEREYRSWSSLLVRLWPHWLAVRADQLLEAGRLGSDKLEYLTTNAEMSTSNRCTRAGCHVDDLLPRRMLALELDPFELAASDPALLRHLRRCCSLCERPQDCALDLASASTDPTRQGRDDWQDYCENALTLEMLVALRSRSKPAPKYQPQISP
jgi:hypothetical protein